ncbi:MAG: electron transfer flavoprotein subunit alpha/FixB family protein [Saprospiraceae bacterium]
MILVLIEIQDGKIKKSSLESLCFAAQIAIVKGLKVKAICFGAEDCDIELGDYGADELLVVSNSATFENDQIANVICQLNVEMQAEFIILSLNSTGKNIAGIIAVKTQKALLSGVVGLKQEANGISFVKNVYSGKATVYYHIEAQGAVLAIMPNGVSIQSDKAKKATKQILKIEPQASRIKTIEKRMVKGKVPLTEASIVVSAGRGMKDPGNWAMIEEMAELLGASTACSRPVADVGWRPHHEHVGQTGIAIRPNVYIAIGISGAIQHLAGVNNSRKIIVINKDPEAPFFKAADYGICGDLFEVVPKINEAIKRAKSNS